MRGESAEHGAASLDLGHAQLSGQPKSGPEARPVRWPMIYLRSIRNSDISPNSCRFEQASSDDGGKTWEVNWIAMDARITDDVNATR